MSHASVSRLGLAVWSVKAGKQKDLGSIPLLLFSLFKSCGLWVCLCEELSVG